MRGLSPFGVGRHSCGARAARGVGCVGLGATTWRPLGPMRRGAGGSRPAAAGGLEGARRAADPVLVHGGRERRPLAQRGGRSCARCADRPTAGASAGGVTPAGAAARRPRAGGAAGAVHGSTAPRIFLRRIGLTFRFDRIRAAWICYTSMILLPIRSESASRITRYDGFRSIRRLGCCLGITLPYKSILDDPSGLATNA